MKGAEDMKYILMMNTMKAGRGVPEWPKKDLQAHIAFMKSFDKELRESGELVSARRQLVLSGSSQACAGWQGWGADPLNMPIEVRPVMSAPPPEML
jgi:hypothetical protein